MAKAHVAAWSMLFMEEQTRNCKNVTQNYFWHWLIVNKRDLCHPISVW
jgi:hypothetical protein